MEALELITLYCEEQIKNYKKSWTDEMKHMEWVEADRDQGRIEAYEDVLEVIHGRKSLTSRTTP